MFDFKINVDAFVRSMVEARKRLAHAVLYAVRRAGELAERHAKSTTLFKDDTHELRRSIQTQIVDDHTVKVVADSPHAAWVERGNGFRTGRSFIEPTTQPFLVFYIDGRKIVTRKVKTSAPRPFMAEAQAHAAPLFEELCVQAVDNMFG